MLIFQADISYVLLCILKFFICKLAMEYGRTVVHERTLGRLKTGMSKDVALSENDLKVA